MIKKQIAFSVFFLFIFFGLIVFGYVYADMTTIKYFLKYDTFKKTFSDDITEVKDKYKGVTHYVVTFDGGNVVNTEHHFFTDIDYIITYYKGVDTPLKEVTYRNINKDISMLDMVKLIEQKHNLISSFLYSKVTYTNGNFSRSELFRNGKIVAYKDRYYSKTEYISYPIPTKEESWEMTEFSKNQREKIIKNSLLQYQKVLDGKGFELKTVWLYDIFGFYKAEDYDKGELKYYHNYIYYNDSRIELKNLKSDYDYGEMTKNEYNQRRKEIIKKGCGNLIKQIDDFIGTSNIFSTRRFYTELSTLLEIRYYDKNNVNRLIEYYNTSGNISAIDIKDENGFTIDTYDSTEVDMEFFLEKRRQVREGTL